MNSTKLIGPRLCACSCFTVEPKAFDPGKRTQIYTHAAAALCSRVLTSLQARDKPSPFRQTLPLAQSHSQTGMHLQSSHPSDPQAPPHNAARGCTSTPNFLTPAANARTNVCNREITIAAAQSLKSVGGFFRNLANENLELLPAMRWHRRFRVPAALRVHVANLW